MKKVGLVLFWIGLCALPSLALPPPALLTIEAVDSIHKTLSLEEKIGQLIDLKVAPDDQNIDDIEALVKKFHIGSLTVTGGDPKSLVQLVNRLNKTQKIPIFVSGENDRRMGLPYPQMDLVPSPATFARTKEHLLAEQALNEINAIAKDIGMNGLSFNTEQLIFNSEGLHKVHLWDFGENYQTYSSAQYAIDNMAPTSHVYFDLTTQEALDSRKSEAKKNNEKNQASIEKPSNWNKLNGNSSIMIVHDFPRFLAEEAGEMNKKIVSSVFKKSLNFKGVLSIEPFPYRGSYLGGKSGSSAKFMKAGFDKIIVSPSLVESVIPEITSSLDQKYLKQGDIKSKSRKILQLKNQLGLLMSRPLLINEDHAERRLESPHLSSICYQTFEKASEIKTEGELEFPFKGIDQTTFASLSLGFSNLKTFPETLEKYAPFTHFMLPDPAFDPYDLQVLLRQLSRFDNVIVGFYSNDLQQADAVLSDFIRDLNRNTNLSIVYFGHEIDQDEFHEVPHQVCMHEDNLYTQRIGAQIVFGANNPFIGRLDYAIPEMKGMDSKVLMKIDEIAEETVSTGAAPGCQILVVKDGSVILEKGYGYYTYDSIMPVDTRTIYDVASITKVAATTQAMMKLSEEGVIDLDEPISTYLPELIGTNKENLIIREILAHQSGLKAFYPFWRFTVKNNEQVLHYYKQHPDHDFSNTVAYGMFAGGELKDSLWHWTIDTKLRRKSRRDPKYDYKYSDLGFYLLQNLIERTISTPLDHYLDSVFYRPMGMSTMTYNPLCKYQLKRITPTEWDHDFRNVLVWGTVHDEIAAMKGGVSGHAGLFSNAHDIAKIMQMQLQMGQYGGEKFFDESTVEEFSQYFSDESRRGLGWDKPERSDEYNPASRYASFDSFGHSGFTGTIVWTDPTFNLVYVFLSNRIYPNDQNSKLSKLNIRKRIQDVLYESIFSYAKY